MIQKFDIGDKTKALIKSHNNIFQEMEAQAYISHNEKVSKPPTAISIGEHTYKGTSYPTTFGSYGDYSCIVGSSKSKKTFLKSALTASYLGGNAVEYFPEIKGHETYGKIVLDFDTEQSRFHSKRVLNRVNDMVGSAHPDYKFYTLRKYSPMERVNFIDYLIDKYKERLGLVCIDGLADLVDDFNDLKKANYLQQKLLTWTAETNCHLIGVLHKNYGSEKPVGHLGSSILKKAETIVFNDIDEQNKENVIVTPAYTRNYPFDTFKYSVNKDWLPHEVGIF